MSRASVQSTEATRLWWQRETVAPLLGEAQTASRCGARVAGKPVALTVKIASF